MSVARVIELSATSDQGFEDAINQGIQRATNTLRNVQSAWVKDMNVEIQNNQVTWRIREGARGEFWIRHGPRQMISANTICGSMDYMDHHMR